VNSGGGRNDEKNPLVVLQSKEGRVRSDEVETPDVVGGGGDAYAQVIPNPRESFARIPLSQRVLNDREAADVGTGF
jgi:hypothetical protein